MGPRSENRGYAGRCGPARSSDRSFNGSTVREPWLCPVPAKDLSAEATFQWVHGQRTVVMQGNLSRNASLFFGFNGSTVREPWLCHNQVALHPVVGVVSMGPRSENRGYDERHSSNRSKTMEFQWVHGQRTVVMNTEDGNCTIPTGSFNGSTVREPWLWVCAAGGRSLRERRFNGSTVREPWLWQRGPRQNPETGMSVSMGPRSENRGYGPCCSRRVRSLSGVSMGPRSENRGYATITIHDKVHVMLFQWVHGQRTVVMAFSSAHSTAR